MSLVIRLATIGFFLSMLLVGGQLIPPFPPAFGEGLTTIFEMVLRLDTWFPVKLALNLVFVRAAIEVAVYTFRAVVWFKNFVLGDGS